MKGLKIGPFNFNAQSSYAPEKIPVKYPNRKCSWNFKTVSLSKSALYICL